MAMKISDKELLDAVWENQLRLLSRTVLHKYMGGSYGLACGDDFWFYASSSEHIVSRQRVTDLISKKHLRSRIVSLINEGKIHSPNGDRVLGFCIDSDLAREAFSAAREFWLSKGVPEGHSEGRANTVRGIDFDAIAAECEGMLLKRFYGSEA
ncbi:hypothetical protein [Marinobacterium jannaschii]|uniref:hypothetical protein n=1 Tax=Marinobacterium jannaschii TaxID=64970 RepID=UPI0004836CE0|nr:hypothetical protein [Marinobacterium jannaschii]